MNYVKTTTVDLVDVESDLAFDLDVDGRAEFRSPCEQPVESCSTDEREVKSSVIANGPRAMATGHSCQ
jgi:hypothetical protein